MSRSYAAATKVNRLPPSQQPHPDTALLSTPSSSSSSEEFNGENSHDSIQIVSAEEVASPRAAMQNEATAISTFDTSNAISAPSTTTTTTRSKPRVTPSPPAPTIIPSKPIVTEIVDAGRKTVAKASTSGDKSSSSSQKPKLKELDTPVVVPIARAAIDKEKVEREKLHEQVSKKAEEIKRETREQEKKIRERANVKGQELKKGIERRTSEMKKRAEGVEKDVEKVVRRYPAATGLIGLVNVAAIGTLSYLAYSHWHLPQWDRRTVTLTSLALGSLFVGEGLLGYYEIEEEKKR